LLLNLYLFLLGLLIAIPGLSLTFMALFTDHTVTHYNINILLANPLSLLLVYYAIRLNSEKTKIMRRINLVWLFHFAMAGLLLAAKIIGLYLQDNWLILAFTLTLYSGMWLITSSFIFRKKPLA